MNPPTFSAWSPRRALAVVVLLLAGVACGGEPADGADQEGVDPGGLQGELVVHIFNLGEQSQVLYWLRLPGGQQRQLRFAEPPELASGVGLRVFGADDGQVVAVSRFEVTGAGTGEMLDVQQRALIDGPSKPAKRWAFVLVDTGAGVNLNAATARERLFSDKPDSIRSYYREVSYGLQELSGDVLGPFQITPRGEPLRKFHQGGRAAAADDPGDLQPVPLVPGQPHRQLSLGGGGAAGDRGGPDPPQLLQRHLAVCGAGAGARAQLRDGALVEPALPARRSVGQHDCRRQRGGSARTANTATPSIPWVAGPAGSRA